MLGPYRNYTFPYTGPSKIEDGNPIPVGLSKISCTDYISIAYLDRSSEAPIVNMFTLDPGKQHVVRCPSGVDVVVECGKNVKWIVKYSQRFNKSDPNRHAVKVRPRSQMEEMQDYLNEAAARAYGKDLAEKLRKGQVEFDISQDDYSEQHEEDEVAPLTTHQLGLIIEEIQADILARQKDVEEEAPPVPLKDGKNNAGPKGDALGSKETGEVKQK